MVEGVAIGEEAIINGDVVKSVDVGAACTRVKKRSRVESSKEMNTGCMLFDPAESGYDMMTMRYIAANRKMTAEERTCRRGSRRLLS